MEISAISPIAKAAAASTQAVNQKATESTEFLKSVLESGSSNLQILLKSMGIGHNLDLLA